MFAIAGINEFDEFLRIQRMKMETKTDLIYKDEVFALIGAAMEVHSQLGPGFLESVYQEALQMELKARDIPHFCQIELPIYYKGTELKKRYITDLVCYDKIIVELKAINRLAANEFAQTLNYLKATQIKLGLLLNFCASSLESKRVPNFIEKFVQFVLIPKIH